MFIGTLFVNTLFASVTAWLIYFYLKCNFNTSAALIRVTLFIVCFGSLNGVLSTLCMKFLSNDVQFIKSLLILLLSIALIKFLLKVDLIRSLLAFCIIGLAVSVGNFIGPLIMAAVMSINVTPDTISQDLHLLFLMNVLVYLIALTLIMFTPFIRKISQIKNLKPISFMLAITFLIIAVNTSVHFIVHFNFFNFASILISSLTYLVSSIWYILKYQRYELKLEEQNQQAFYNESLGLVLQDLKRFKHDQANHLNVINAMIQMGKCDEARSYIKEIVVTSESFTNTAIFNIRNAGLFGIISSKMNKADKLGVSFELNTTGTIDSIPNIKISELCEIIGIYLDNAIEAAQLSSRKFIEMSVMDSDGLIGMIIKNSCDCKPDMTQIKTYGYSSKGSNRGQGLSIVDTILKKHTDIHNVTRFDSDNEQFIQTLEIKKG